MNCASRTPFSTLTHKTFFLRPLWDCKTIQFVAKLCLIPAISPLERPFGASFSMFTKRALAKFISLNIKLRRAVSLKMIYAVNKLRILVTFSHIDKSSLRLGYIQSIRIL